MRIPSIFKSRLRGRIESKIEFLAIERAAVMYEKQNTRITNTREYCNLSLSEDRLNEKIELLKSLLE